MVKQVLQTHQIDAFVMDTPTARYISADEVPGSVMVAQFPSTGEHYGLLFTKGNPLVTCVNKALAALTANGTLAALQKQYLKIYLHRPHHQAVAGPASAHPRATDSKPAPACSRRGRLT